MPDRRVDVLLIGGGVASVSAAQALREEGFGGSVLLVGRELDHPYDRPPLTKQYLAGSMSRADTALQPPAWYEEQRIELLTRTSVTALDLAAREATLSTKETVGFDRALLATGAMVRRLNVEGAQLEGIHYVRALANSDQIRADVHEGTDVVCVGGSYISIETAATLTTLGCRVTVVMLEQQPFERTFGERVGAWYRALLEGHGIRVIGGAELAAFAGPGERVEEVVTASGERIAAQAVVVGAGVTPDVLLARRAGLAIGGLGGVLCDANLRTSGEGVWAAGDICEYESVVHRRPLRVEHVDHAGNQGAFAGRALAGATGDYDVVPYFFSDLADWTSMEYVGPAERWDDEVVRGSFEDGAFGVWYLEGGYVRGALSVGGGLDLDAARELLRAGETVAPEDLP